KRRWISTVSRFPCRQGTSVKCFYRILPPCLPELSQEGAQRLPDTRAPGAVDQRVHIGGTDVCRSARKQRVVRKNRLSGCKPLATRAAQKMVADDKPLTEPRP